MLRILVNALRTGVVTSRYPEEPSVPPARFRRLPVLQPGGRRRRPSVCPASALSESVDDGHGHVDLDVARCVFCGRFAEGQWAGAVKIGREFQLSARRRDDLLVRTHADDVAVDASEPALTEDEA